MPEHFLNSYNGEGMAFGKLSRLVAMGYLAMALLSWPASPPLLAYNTQCIIEQLGKLNNSLKAYSQQPSATIHLKY